MSKKISTKHLVTASMMLAIGGAQASLIDNMVVYYDFETDLANHAPGATAYDATISTGGDTSVATTGDWRTGPTDASGPGFTGIAAFDPGDGLSDRSTLLAGNALNLIDADNTFITAPVGTAQLGQTFSISAWVYLAPGDANASGRFHAMEADSNWDVSWGNVSGNTALMRAYVGQTVLTPDTAITHEQWQHVVQVFTTDGTTTTLNVYLDGSTTPAISGTTATANMNFTGLNFGDCRDNVTDRDWDGMLDEVAIWDRALTATEVNRLYTLGQAGQAIPEPATIGLVAVFGGAMLLARRKFVI